MGSKRNKKAAIERIVKKAAEAVIPGEGLGNEIEPPEALIQRASSGVSDLLSDPPDFGALELDPDDYNKLMYDRAVELVLKKKKGSPTLLQREFGITYTKASSFIQRMTEEGLLSKDNTKNAQDALISLEDWSAGFDPAQSGVPRVQPSIVPGIEPEVPRYVPQAAGKRITTEGRNTRNAKLELSQLEKRLAANTERKAMGRVLRDGVSKAAAVEAGVEGAGKAVASAKALKAVGKLSKGFGKAALGFGVGGTALAAASLLLDPAVEMVKGAGESLGLREPVEFQRSLQAQQQMALAERVQRRKKERLDRLTQENAANIAVQNPHLFQEILAGRELPRDAVVLGGRPRTDLLKEVARNMAAGNYQQSNITDDLLQ